MKHGRKKILSIGLVLLLVGCAASPHSQQARVSLPFAWGATEDFSNTPLVAIDRSETVEHFWWNHFDDDVLNTIIKEAINGNKSLKVARARTTEARAERLSSYSLLMPQINVSASGQRGNQGAATFDKTVSQTDVGLQASWEIDLFGGNQARATEASALLESQQASQQAVLVGLLGEVARNYFDLLSYQEQLNLTERNIELQRRALEIVQAQYKEKIVSDLDIQRVGAQLATTEAELPNLKTALSASRNRLQVLLGGVPGADWHIMNSNAGFKPLSHKLLVAAPASVIAARPDVRAAERRLAASVAAVEAATADLFPKVSLTAFFGAQTLAPQSFTPWGLGVNLLQPVLNFGKLQAQVNINDSQQEQALYEYQQTILESLEDMENALSAYINETSRNASLREASQRSSKAQQIAKILYQQGQTGLLDLLLAQQALLAGEAALVKSDAELRKFLVAIYISAGGGWKDE